MTSSTSATATPSDFVPAELDATSWDNVAPLFDALSTRDIATAEDLEAWLVDRSELEAACSEAAARLYINMSCDTDDEGHSAAYTAYIENVRPKLTPAGFALDTRQAELAEKLDLTSGRYEVLHRDTKAEVDLYREENVPLQTELSKLSQRFQKVAGAMSVEFEGETKTLPQMSVYQESPDRAVREKAWRVVSDRRLRDVDEIDSIFDEAVTKRHEMATNSGFDDYVGYAFAMHHRFDYTPAECTKFHDAVEQVVMPFVADLDAKRAEQLGVPELSPWDVSCDPKGKDPLRPFNGGVDLVSKTRAVMDALDPQLAGFFRELGDGANDKGIEGGLLDLDSRGGKAPGGYQYMQDRSRVPFIFMNAAGVQRDVETMVHEAGHAFHSMLCNHEPLLHYRHSPIEFAEVASMTMELLSASHWGVKGGYYEDPAELARARRKHLEGTLSILPWIATIDAFQHWVYSNPTHTRDERTNAWLGLMDRFGMAGHKLAWTEDTRPALRTRWQAQSHLFGHPFYYIEYGIAQLGALQLWVKGLEEGEAAAVAAYKKALSLGGSRPLPELFEAAGISFDFSASMFEKVRERVEAELAKLPE